MKARRPLLRGVLFMSHLALGAALENHRPLPTSPLSVGQPTADMFFPVDLRNTLISRPGNMLAL